MQTCFARFTVATVATCVCAAAQAQVAQIADGQWRAMFTAGATLSSGNSDARSVSFSADAVKMTFDDKWSLNAATQYAHSNGEQTANREDGTARYSSDFGPRWFGFGQLELLRDAPAALSLRSALGSGAGYHLLQYQDHSWDVSGGLAYTYDRYSRPLEIDGVQRNRYRHVELLLGEESHHKFSDTTSLKQKLSVYRDLHESGDVRAVFDTALSVAMTQRLSLTASLSYRFDSNPGEGLGRNDTLVVTGVSWRIE